MADILADYREWRTQQAIRVSTHSAGCHMWHRDCMIHRLAAALAVEQAKRTPAEPSTPSEGTRQAGCTLTDEEVEAVRWFASGDSTAFAWGWKFRAETLRNMLERLG